MVGSATYWFTWFPGALLAFFGCIALAWKSLRWLMQATSTLKQLQTSLPVIEAEFSPNHGTTMKDRVEALHVTVDKLAYDTSTWQRQHARDDDRRFAKTEAAMERIEDHLTR